MGEPVQENQLKSKNVTCSAVQVITNQDKRWNGIKSIRIIMISLPIQKTNVYLNQSKSSSRILVRIDLLQLRWHVCWYHRKIEHYLMNIFFVRHKKIIHRWQVEDKQDRISKMKIFQMDYIFRAKNPINHLIIILKW